MKGFGSFISHWWKCFAVVYIYFLSDTLAIDMCMNLCQCDGERIICGNNVTDWHVNDILRNISESSNITEVSFVTDNLTGFPLSIENMTFPKVTKLSISGSSGMRTVPRNVSDVFPNLQVFVLGNNGIENITTEDLNGLEHLQILDLSGNEIRELKSGIFQSLLNLKELILNNNEISRIDRNAFQGITNLTKLEMENNNLSNRKGLSLDVFHPFDNANIEISVRGNQLETLSAILFQSMKSFRRFDFSNNNISIVENDAFSGLLLKNATLDLSSNKMTKLPVMLFNDSTWINSVIDLSDMNIECNCDVYKSLYSLIAGNRETVKLIGTCYSTSSSGGDGHNFTLASLATQRQLEIYKNTTCNACEISSSDVCMNNGTCESNNITHLTCRCTEEYKGEFCESKNNRYVDPCTSNPCLNNGTCININETHYSCENCSANYYGINCNQTTRINICDNSPCKNGGSCKPINKTNLECTCPSNYSGELCESYNNRQINPCTSNPCLNNGTCVNINETHHSCENCSANYYGINCNQTTRINICDNSPCKNGGSCKPINKTDLECACPSNYSGEFCEDKAATDPCLVLDSTCLNNGTCIRVNDTNFLCNCTHGFTGHTCNIPQDPCLNFTCLNNGTCRSIVNTVNVTCECPDEYYGSKCEYRYNNVCESNICHHGNCTINGTNDFYCNCETGYSGKRCDIADRNNNTICNSDSCQNNGTCIAGQYHFVCNCTKGFNGRYCENRTGDKKQRNHTQCDIRKCMNNGTCLPVGSNGYKCECLKNYTGENCETDINNLNCSKSPCQNGGTCFQIGLSNYKCQCPHKYSGTNCEKYNMIAEATKRKIIWGTIGGGIAILILFLIIITVNKFRVRRHWLLRPPMFRTTAVPNYGGVQQEVENDVRDDNYTAIDGDCMDDQQRESLL